MKKVIMAWGVIFLSVILCGPAQAAIEWDTVLVANTYVITSQGGTFRYFSSGPPVIPVYQNDQGALNDINTSEVAEYFGPYPGEAILYSQSSGGILPMGSQVQVYADITYTDGVSPNHFDTNTHGMNVSQHVTAQIVRKFTNPGDTPITIDLLAEFTGAIDFESFNYDYATGTVTNNDTYAYYVLNGTVSITEFVPQSNSQTTWSVVLDNDTWSDTLTDLVIHPASEDYYYFFSTTLTVDTFVKNWSSGMTGFCGFPLDGNFFIGSDPSNPLTLTATVPVPPSVLLLISGLGGLIFARRRFSDGRRKR